MPKISHKKKVVACSMKHVQSTYHAKNIPQGDSGSMLTETRSINLPCQKYPTRRKKHVQSTYHDKNIPQGTVVAR
jgi:hypothetical protein